MRRTSLLAAAACALLVAAGCGSATTDEERSIAGLKLLSRPATHGGPAEATAGADTFTESAPTDAAATGAATPDGAPQGGSSPSADPAANRTTAPGPGSTRPVGPDRDQASPGTAPTTAPAAPSPGSKAPTPAGSAKGEIVFGSFGVETGVMRAITAPVVPAIRAWAADVNSRGGLNGHRVRVIFAEDGGDPGRAQAVVRTMVEQDKVLALFYPYAVGTIDAVMPYLEAQRVPLYGGTVGADVKVDYSTMGFNLFPGADKGLGWEMIINLTEQTDKRKTALLYCREVVICQHQRQVVQQNLPYKGMEIVYEAQISLAQPDFTAEALSAQRAGADVMLIFADINSIGRFAQSAHRQNYDPVLVTARHVQTDFALSLAEELEGLLMGSLTMPYDSPRMADYRQAIAKYQPNTIQGSYGAAAWVAGRVLELRIAPLLDNDPARDEFVEALYTLRNETLGGLLPGVTFPRGRDRSNVNLCTIPVKFTGGKFVAHGSGSFVCAPEWRPGA